MHSIHASHYPHVPVTCVSQMFGGGIFINAEASGGAFLFQSVVSRCSVSSSQAGLGGGIDIQSGTLNMVQCLVTECVAGSPAPQADGVGGGIAVQKGDVSLSLTRITRCRAFALESQATGGGLSINDGTVTITNCSIVDCAVTAINGDAFGGGLIIQGGSIYMIATHVVGCTALVNITRLAGTNLYSSSGGGVLIAGGTSEFVDCLFMTCATQLYGKSNAGAGASLKVLGGGLSLIDGVTQLVSITVRACQSWYGGGINLSTPPGSAVSMSEVKLADNRATTSGTAIFLANAGLDRLLRIDAFLMKIEPHCPVAEERNVPIIDAFGVDDPVLSLRALAVRRGPCTTPAPLVYGFTLPTCNATFPSLTVSGQRVDYCGQDATCVAHDPEYLTPACECAPPTYPSPLAAYPLHAPYREGCVLPIEAANLTHVAPSIY